MLSSNTLSFILNHHHIPTKMVDQFQSAFPGNSGTFYYRNLNIGLDISPATVAPKSASTQIETITSIFGFITLLQHLTRVAGQS